MKLRKILSSFLSLCMVACITYVPSSVFANENIAVYYEGSQIAFDVQPENIGGFTMVPARYVFEAMGAKVKWDEETGTVTVKKKKKSISMIIGGAITDQDSFVIETDAVPVIIDDITLVSVRLVAEFFGANVEWDENNNSVYITDQEKVTDNTWKENTGKIDMSSFTTNNDNGVTIDENVVMITKGGDFEVTGSTKDGMILVNTDDRVKLRLSGTDIENPNGPAIFFEDVDIGFITLTENTTNTLTDGTTNDYLNSKATLFSDDDLEIKGNGSLIINANYNHGIASDNDIKIESGNININITSKGDGIQSDLWNVIIDGGNINIITTGEISSTSNNNFNGRPDQWSTTDENQGDTVVGNDTVQQNNQAQNPFGQNGRNNNISQLLEDIDITEFADMTRDEVVKKLTEMIDDGTLSINGIVDNNQNADSASNEEVTGNTQSSKGIKANEDIYINAGNIIINSTDHSVHSGDITEVNSGYIEINSSAGKGFSAHGDLTINFGKINIINATEGIESKAILRINGGDIHINASDDGMNSGGSDTNIGKIGFGGDTGMTQDRIISILAQSITKQNNVNGEDNFVQASFSPDSQIDNNEINIKGGQTNVKSSRPQDGYSSGNRDENTGFVMGNASENGHNIIINNGYIFITSKGDGIDSNGRLEINGGTVIVNGPSSGADTALDSDGKMLINGGFVVAVGGVGMLKIPSDESEQNIIVSTLESSKQSGAIINIKDENENSILTFKPQNGYQSIIFSSSDIETNKTYTVSTEGTVSSETNVDGIYDSAQYSNGTILGNMEVTSIITRIGNTTSDNFGGGNNVFDSGRAQNKDQSTETSIPNTSNQPPQDDSNRQHNFMDNRDMNEKTK